MDAKLAGFVREYIRSSIGDVPSEEAEALRWVCSGLESLLGGLLDGSDGWNGWVDGVDPATDVMPGSINVISAVQIEIRGRALWYQHPQGAWIEPFFGSLRISETRDEIVSYEIKFGDAGRGLGMAPYGKHIRRPDWFFPTEWLYSFSKGAIDGT